MATRWRGEGGADPVGLQTVDRCLAGGHSACELALAEPGGFARFSYALADFSGERHRRLGTLGALGVALLRADWFVGILSTSPLNCDPGRAPVLGPAHDGRFAARETSLAT